MLVKGDLVKIKGMKHSTGTSIAYDAGWEYKGTWSSAALTGLWLKVKLSDSNTLVLTRGLEDFYFNKEHSLYLELEEKHGSITLTVGSETSELRPEKPEVKVGDTVELTFNANKLDEVLDYVYSPPDGDNSVGESSLVNFTKYWCVTDVDPMLVLMSNNYKITPVEGTYKVKVVKDVVVTPIRAYTTCVGASSQGDLDNSIATQGVTHKSSQESLERPSMGSYRYTMSEAMDEAAKMLDSLDLEPKAEEAPEVCPIAARVTEKMLERAAVGLKKYGVTADRNDLSIMDWLTHAQEEAMDLAIYLEKIKKELGSCRVESKSVQSDFTGSETISAQHKVRLFVRDIEKVCRTHMLCINHEDTGGNFIAEKYKEDEDLKWFRGILTGDSIIELEA